MTSLLKTINRVPLIHREVERELLRAIELHPQRYHSLHEGLSIIREEYEELWDEVKLKQPDRVKLRAEAVQVIATCYRLILDVID